MELKKLAVIRIQKDNQGMCFTQCGSQPQVYCVLNMEYKQDSGNQKEGMGNKTSEEKEKNYTIHE